ncbi:cytochrome P450 4c21-like [Diaphorina citri]|uniref:Cytochrome P450 4c21-like n=2 Tax=Diaphorina citri TaxID=121845 RepID=A0A3Q0JE84_DIACI|nr:cytochrome P450 4c21-like [Diaphorina citri]
MFGVDFEIQQNHYSQHPYLEAVESSFRIFLMRVFKPWLAVDPFYTMSGCKARVRKNRSIQKEFMKSIIDEVERKIFEENVNFIDSKTEEEIPFLERVLRDRLDPSSTKNPQNSMTDKELLHEMVGHEVERKIFEENVNFIDSKTEEEIPFLERVLRDRLDPSSTKNPQNSMTDKELLHEMVGVLNAGIDTVTFTTSIVLIVLAVHPQIQQEVYHELQDVLGDSPDSAPTYDQLQRLDLLTRVIKETMRLFPAAPVIARSAPYEVQCGDYTIPAGATIGIFIYGLHRHPQLWNNPNQFDPDRFLPSQSSHRNPSGYVPFSLGPRGCIGSKYAMLQMKTTISTILRRYKILPGDKCKSLQDIRFEFGMTMRSLPGNDIRIEPR